jgi:hypothetical protein
MIVYSSVDVKQVKTEGRKYAWERPEKCGMCHHSRVWGHGYVARYFDGYEEALWIKRWRCPACGAVHTMRPERYWRKFQAACTDIEKSLKSKIEHGRWLDSNGRQRQQYWWRGFKKQVMRVYGMMAGSLEKALEQLQAAGVIFASHRVNQCEASATG